MKNKNKKRISIALAASIGLSFCTSYLFDSYYVNHLEGECLFNGILGSNHQVNQINKQYKDLDIVARKVSLIATKKEKYYMEPIITYNDAGDSVIHIPDGYDYDRVSQKCVKEKYTHEPLLDKHGNEILEKYIIIGNEEVVNQKYYYDYECTDKGLSLIKLS